LGLNQSYARKEQDAVVDGTTDFLYFPDVLEKT
jgi:hypothetical protein